MTAPTVDTQLCPYKVEIPESDLADLAFDREGLVPTVAYETTYASSVAGMADAGLGVGILPESVAETSRLVRLRIRNNAMTRRIGFLTRAGRSLSPTADKLRQVMHTIARSSRHKEEIKW